MAITGRTLDELRAIALDKIAAAATAAGLTIAVDETSDAWREADAIASMVLGYEASSEQLAREIDPRTASEATLDRWLGMARLSPGDGVAGAYTVSISGQNGTVDLGARVLVRGGRRYTPTATSVTIAGGVGEVTVTAQETGTDAALEAGDVLRWDASPLGLNPTGTVSAVTETAEDGDGVEDKRATVVGYLRARPSAGNPSQIKALAERHVDCVVAYVYPACSPIAGTDANLWDDARLDVPGTFIVIALGAPQGTNPVTGSPAHARDLSTDQVTSIQEYLRGARGADGVELATPVGQRFSTQILPTDVEVGAAVMEVVNVETAITPTQGARAGWSGTMTVASSTTTTVVVSGNHSAKAGKTAIFYVGIAAARGGWVQREVATASYDGISETTLEVEALPDVASGTVYPALGHWEALRDAYFDWFDALGPGDVPSIEAVPSHDGTARRRRFPPLSWGAKANVSLADLIRLAFAATGTLNATVAAPVADVAEAPFQLPVLGTLLIRPA